MLIDIEQLRLATLSAQTQLFLYQTGKGFIETFILLNSPTRHKPEPLGRPVIPFTQQYFSIRIFDNQVD
jgi:hypothetical protein